ncbi:hypothetical protein MUG87_10710 [Ectobacillus sp. JY-23]|uniref:hypothetical protein n=1 Tax=Ectobacillus sp. JY-23 TaxID=2933872 RepID=UPI001FF25A78|nr:hypothetical protein [Ectobacillus sp. JY-23]UOY91043.1 hypothetical protein MUG87_10710 [Ectobacillus sp. JY-23]
MQQLDVLKQFSIHSSELITGVQCPHCGKFAMRRVYGTWRCDKCHEKSKEGHTLALVDYGLLIKPCITNQQLREFLHIASPDVTKKLLTAMKLSYVGETKGRVYDLTELLCKVTGIFQK